MKLLQSHWRDRLWWQKLTGNGGVFLGIGDKLSLKASCQEGIGDKLRGGLARFGRGDLTTP
ncbi:MAG: hypothetical protein HC775_16725 [Hyellaceae cyanobacterium CSU_1_1]|nr:hypothetical protein [Hyellaceae cyanobacterium CSU_1_1]